MLNKDQLKTRMRDLLLYFDDEGITITDDTIHNQVLSDSDGHPLSSEELYNMVITQKLFVNGNPDRAWPSDWMGTSVDTLAGKLTT